MIYAKVDVKLRDHERAHRAGPSMATWTWALLYVREQESDGYIPDVALRGAWVGEKDALRHAAKLVEVGLWEIAEGGWRICRYADKNETRAVIAERRKEARERMHRVRANSSRTNSEPPAHTERTNEVVPGSGYVEVKDQVPDSERPASGRRDVPGNDAGPPEWWPGAVAATELVVGSIANPAAMWVEYDASRDRKNWARSHRDAVGWLTSVKRSEGERRAQSGTRLRANTIVQSAENRAWIVPKEMP